MMVKRINKDQTGKEYQSRLKCISKKLKSRAANTKLHQRQQDAKS